MAKRKKAEIIKLKQVQEERVRIPEPIAYAVFMASWQFLNLMRSINRSKISIPEMFAEDGEILIDIKNEDIRGYLYHLGLACFFNKIKQVGFTLEMMAPTVEFLLQHIPEFIEAKGTMDPRRRHELMETFLPDTDVIFIDPLDAPQAHDIPAEGGL